MINNFFFRKERCLRDNLEKYCNAGQGTDNKMAHAHFTQGTEGYRRTLSEYGRILLFHYSNDCTNAPQSYVTHTLPLLFLLRLTAFLIYRKRLTLDNIIQECPACLAKVHSRYCGL